MTTTRKLYQIAADIRRHWPNVNYAAEPYLNAMSSLNDTTENYFSDSAVSIVKYFLINASTWRGEDARRIKAELKAMI